MKQGEKVELHITATAQDGRGIARKDGLVVFVLGTLEGERVIAEIYTAHKTYATAGVVEILEYSPYRADAFCEAAENCGGCPLAHITYEKQLKIKKQTVMDALTRLGKFDLSGVEVSDTKGMENPFCYRNKMVFPLETKHKKTVGGFYERRSHNVVPLTTCDAGEKAASIALSVVVDFLNKEGISAYDEDAKKGSLRRVFVRTAYHTKELMIVLSSATENVKNISALVDALTKTDFKEYTLKSILLNINQKPNNLVLGEKNKTLWGEDTIKDTLLGLSFTISPHSFFQVNPVQTEVLYQTALDFAEIDNTKTVLDIYCGIGTISLCAAKTAKEVVGVEIVEKAISDATENAKRNSIKNAEFYCGAAETIVPKLIEEKGFSPDVVIVDPPRKGSDEKTLGAILKANPKRIVYVSCNPATLARDARFLADGGYNLKKIVPVDMFPHTEHVETVALLSKE